MYDKETTFRAVFIGLVMSFVMLAAAAYLGLKAGMTVGASIPSAVLALAILRRPKGTHLECNIIQTAASTGETLAAGAIFTIPALVLTGVWQEFDFVKTTLIAMSGGILGVLMMIPLRRTLIASPTLGQQYPEGTACAKVIQAGGDPSALRSIASAVGLGGLLSFLIRGGTLAENIFTGFRVGSTAFPLGISASPALLSVGYIVGFNIAMLVVLGGVIAWLVVIPIIGAGSFDLEHGVFEQALGLWKVKARYIGVGAMVVGGLWTIVKLSPQIRDAVKSLFLRAEAGTEIDRTERDMHRGGVLFLGVLAFVMMAGLFISVTTSVVMGLGLAIVMAMVAMLMVAISSYICGLVGSSNNPVSGMTIFTLLITATLVLACGMGGSQAVAVTLTVAGVVCCAACTAGNTSQDLKTGFLLQATPGRQQWVCILCVVLPSLIVAPVLWLLSKSYGWDADHGGLAAPQARLFASIAQGFFQGGAIPWGMVALGAFIGLGLGVLNEYLKRTGSAFRTHIMPVAVGMYLPLQLSTAIFVGGLVRYFVSRGRAKAATVEDEAMEQAGPGVLFASGLIAGEAIMAVLLAFPVILGIPFDRLSPEALGLGTLALLVYLFIRAEKRKQA